MAHSEVELPPDPARTIEGLRDTGYTVETALADIVDNSISAGATVVKVGIAIEPDGAKVVYVADNGSGMSEDGLLTAMTYGSPPRPDPKSLGKFGLGLKTASTAICRQLTVTTRQDSGTPHAAQWDLDYVATKGSWLLRRPDPDQWDAAVLNQISPGGSGTVVTWRKVDRLMKDYENPTGVHAQRALSKIVDGVIQHFSVVYGKFLNANPSSVGATSISINGQLVEPWDPLGLEIGADVILEEPYEVEIDDEQVAQFRIRASVLPPRSELSEAEQRAARISADTAGFYVYREDRCIAAGGWLDMYKVEPHSSLCRIEFTFGHELDEAFQIDIKKSRIEMLEDLWKEVQRAIAPARAEAVERYRKNRVKRTVETSSGRHDPSSKIIDRNASAISGTTAHPLDDETAEVQNSHGSIRLKLRSLKPKPMQARVEAVDSVADGLLYEASLSSGERVVLLNAGHPLYSRCYAEEGVSQQAVDILLWALVEAEVSVVTESDRQTLKNLRYEVSRITRSLAEHLPDMAN